MKHILVKSVFLAGASFFLHCAWERLHIGLYTSYEGLEGILPVWLMASFGDVMYTFIAAGVGTIFSGARLWRAPLKRDYLYLAVIGLCIAVFVEVKAMMLGRWEYTEAMPLVADLGLSPLLQMVILVPLSVFLAGLGAGWFNKKQ